jgi:dGTPase
VTSTTRSILYSDAERVRASGAPGNDPIREKGRSPFKKDYSRLLHAPAFRRLQGKTQLFPGSESDFFRNRLTHSLEVAQIATGVAERLNALLTDSEQPTLMLDVDLVAFAGLAHDLGHPPFGHNGEKALDECMRNYGGFEGNAQTLHILACVEKKGVINSDGQIISNFGLDLCYRTLASVVKYDALIPKCRKPNAKLEKGYYGDEEELVKTIKNKVAPGFVGKFKTVECQIMDLADDIAYSTYDLEDSMHANFVTPLSLMDALIKNDSIRGNVLRKTNDSLTENDYPRINEAELLQHAVAIFGAQAFSTPQVKLPPEASDDFRNAALGVELLSANRSISTDGVYRSRFTAGRVGDLIDRVEFTLNDEYPALSKVQLTRDALLNVEILKHLNFELVIVSSRMAVVEFRGKQLVQDIFTALRTSNGALLPDDWRLLYQTAKSNSVFKAERVLCDFIAGMTDRYAAEFHSAIAGEGATIFKPL